MFINNELKEHRIQIEGMRQCLKGKRQPRNSIMNSSFLDDSDGPKIKNLK